MAWVKLDTGALRHPKVAHLSPLEVVFWVSSLLYSGHYKSDGWIPKSALKGLVPGSKRPQKAAQALVDAGLWEEVDGGWQIHDYGDYQRTSEQIASDEGNNGGGPSRVRAGARLRARPHASAPALDVDVDVEEKTPPTPPKGGRAKDRNLYEERLTAWVGRHFPGVPPHAVAHESALLRDRRIEPTPEALAPRIEAMKERLP